MTTRFVGPLKVGRPPSLKDNAAVATFLASDDSAYMSGLIIPACDGGNFAMTSIHFPRFMDPRRDDGFRPRRTRKLNVNFFPLHEKANCSSRKRFWLLALALAF